MLNYLSAAATNSILEDVSRDSHAGRFSLGLIVGVAPKATAFLNSYFLSLRQSPARQKCWEVERCGTSLSGAFSQARQPLFFNLYHEHFA